MRLEHEKELETVALVGPRDDDGGGDDHSVKVDKVLGNGRYQLLSCVTCGLGVAAGSTEVMAIALALPMIETEFEGEVLTWEKNLMASCIFLGMLLGGLSSGAVADLRGRKSCLIIFTAFIAVFGALTALAESMSQVALFRFLAGLGIGGNIPALFSYVAETTSSRVRGKYMTIVASHWMLGSVITAALGWLILPRDVTLPYLNIGGWRLYFVVCILPAILACVLALAFLVESPCYLIRRKKFLEAAGALEKIVAVNGNRHNDSLFLSELLGLLHSKHAGWSGTGDVLGAEGETLVGGMKHSAVLISQLLKAREQRKLVVVLGTVWFCLSACWYGFMIWLPQFFEAQHDNVYLGNLVTSLGDLPGNVINFFIIDKLGRKNALVLSMGASAVLPLAFAAVPKGSAFWAMLGSASFGFVSVGAWNALSILSPEVFETRLRTTMHGILTALGRIGGFFGTYMVGHFEDQAQSGIWLPCMFASAVLALGLASTAFLPETKGKILTDYRVKGKYSGAESC
ncbi:MFS general substrate transporter [Chloropicon primus]|uniref:MFS general substrate transporter n=3 Tax=Chloropicon primus TaxID=1764295 RepID=A0A5B8MK70_9CHLO|nr:MFS general substrate transporter [Chloropicon primus]UPQ98963.1 MFS general substrate transporter [Chloropicon primus]|eukprot:QDZ19752.1 MFS general substrate transporter [Chloropicon primus]